MQTQYVYAVKLHADHQNVAYYMHMISTTDTHNNPLAQEQHVPLLETRRHDQGQCKDSQESDLGAVPLDAKACPNTPQMVSMAVESFRPPR